MDKFNVVLTPHALKLYKHCAHDLIKKLETCFSRLETNPFSGLNIKPLHTNKGEKLYRYRMGDYRVVYEVIQETKTVAILLISHRSSVYRNL